MGHEGTDMKALIKALGFVAPRAIGLMVAVAMLAMLSGRALADNNQVRWDLISVNFATLTISPGGNASAFAQDGSQIKLTGSGTFRSNSGRPQDVTGGVPGRRLPQAASQLPGVALTRSPVS